MTIGSDFAEDMFPGLNRKSQEAIGRAMNIGKINEGNEAPGTSQDNLVLKGDAIRVMAEVIPAMHSTADAQKSAMVGVILGLTSAIKNQQGNSILELCQRKGVKPQDLIEILEATAFLQVIST